MFFFFSFLSHFLYFSHSSSFKTKVRDSRVRGTGGEYIFSLNGLPETNYNYWISYKVNGIKDTGEIYRRILFEIMGTAYSSF